MKTNARKTKLTAETIRALTVESRIYDVVDSETRGLVLRVRPPSPRHPAGLKTFFCRYRHDGKQTMVKLGDFPLIGVAQARAQATLKRADVLKGLDPMADKKAAKERAKDHTLGSFLDEVYTPWVTRSRKTGAATAARLNAAFKSMRGIELHKVTVWLCEKWRSEKKGAGRSSETTNRDLAVLKSMMNSAVEWGHIETNPMAAVKLDRANRRGHIRYLDAAELAALMAALDKREKGIRDSRNNANDFRRKRGYEEYQDLMIVGFADYLKPMVLLSINCGLRRGELLALRWADVDLIERRLTVRGETAKSGSSRYIPLNGEAMETLKLWRIQVGGDGLVFVNPDTDGPFTTIKTAWHGVLREAKLFIKLKDAEGTESIRYTLRWHDLRHHFASTLVMRGVNLLAVKELLGHSTIQMTERYSHLAPKHLADAVAVLDRPAGEVVAFPEKSALE